MIQRTKGKTAVVGWGRGMGHKGHMLLASAVIHQAKAINATPIFILSRTSLIDPNTGDLWADTKKVRSTKDDPLTPQEKLAIYQKTFPENAKIFTVADGESGTLNDALANLAKQGFSNIVLVVGADQKNAFQYLVNPSKDGSIPYQQMGLQNLVVMSRQETQAPGSEIEGPRATPMRQVLLDPNVSDEQRFAVWRDAMPDSLSDKEVFSLMQKAQQRLGRAEQVAPPKASKAKIKEFIQRVRPMLQEASVEKKIQVLKLLKEACQGLPEGIFDKDFSKMKPSEEELEWQGREENRFPHFYHHTKNTNFTNQQGDSFDYDDPDQREQWLRLYKIEFPDMPTPHDGYWGLKDPSGEVIKALIERGVSEDDDAPAMTPSGVPWQGPKLNREVITPPEGTEWRFGKNAKEDPLDRQDARHFGTALASVPNPISKIGGALMRYAGQDPKDPLNVRVAKALDNAGSPNLNKKSVKEQNVAEAEKPYDLPQRHAMDYGMRKTMIHRLAKATDYEISALSLASDEELTDLYKQVFPDQDINEDYLDEK